MPGICSPVLENQTFHHRKGGTSLQYLLTGIPDNFLTASLTYPYGWICRSSQGSHGYGYGYEQWCSIVHAVE